MPGYELVLLDEHGQPVADGEVGNLHVRGDSALAYYWHQHEKTKAAIKGELVLHRRPLPRSTTNGDYVYEGRADDMIKIGGLWASPIEIENALVEHPRVLEAAAVGIDADFTTRVKAFVICRGDAGDDALVAELQEWCKTPPAPLRVPALHRRSSTICPRRRRARSSATSCGRTHDLHRRRPVQDFAGVETALDGRVPALAGGRARRASRSSSCSPRRTCSASAARRARSWPTRC